MGSSGEGRVFAPKRMAALAVVLTMLLALGVGLVGCSCSTDTAKKEEPKKEEKTDATTVEVPNVVGMTKADAERVIKDAGFKLGAETEEESDAVAAGMVIKQTPTEKTKSESGKEVSLVISKGKAKAVSKVKVPDVTGMSQTQAEEALAALRLVSKAEDPVYNADVAPGKVFKQSVTAGTEVDEGSAVSYWTALGKEVVTVPSVVGQTKDAAVKTLADAAFNVDTIEAYNASVDAGKVISQNPNPKLQVVKGTTVTLVISKGAAPAPTEQVPVPDLSTLSLAQAQGVCESAGLICKYTGSENGYTVDQSIAPGTKVSRGTVVTVMLEELAQ